MMARSNWAQKPGQERVLAVRLGRPEFDQVLSQAVLTSPRSGQSADEWREEMQRAPARVQWDPERSLRGAKLDYRSIQVGLGRQLVRSYALDWVVAIEDVTPLVRKLHGLCLAGKHSEAKLHLPKERPYPVSAATTLKLGML